MPASTPRLTLPYPVPSDTADVPRDVKALADRLDIVVPVGIPFVTSLPASPADGAEVYYQADAANGIVWHLRYRAGSASAYKWEFLGGPPLLVRNETLLQNGTVNGWLNDANGIPTALAGDYLVEFGGAMAMSTPGAQAQMRAATVSGVVSTEVFSGGNVGAGNVGMVSSAQRLNNLPAATTTFVQVAPAATGTMTSYRRWLSMLPYRVA